MRPDRFLRLVTSTAASIPGVTRAEPITDEGKSLRPYLLGIEASGRMTRWQVVAVSAPGDKYDQPEKEPVLGDKPEPPTGTPQSVGSPEQLESALIAALLAADPGEISGYEAYSLRQPAGAIAHGATFLFHDGSKIFLNFVR